MLKVYKILPRGFAANTYLLTADGKTAVVVDPAQERIAEAIREAGLEVKYALLTHGHFDHTGGCSVLAKAGIPVLCGEKEKDLVLGEDSLRPEHGLPLPDFPVQATLKDGDEIVLCGIPFEVIGTPGHTAGGITYRTGDKLFTGDTLFRNFVGRTDLPTGDKVALEKSVRKLYALPGDYTVYAGHGEETTLGEERAHNMCIRG